MTARQIPGQLELILDVPALTEDQRADIATHIVTGWQAMGACRSAGNDTWFPDAGHAAKARGLLDLSGSPFLPGGCPGR